MIGKQCRPWSALLQHLIWVYINCSGLSVPILRAFKVELLFFCANKQTYLCFLNFHKSITFLLAKPNFLRHTAIILAVCWSIVLWRVHCLSMLINNLIQVKFHIRFHSAVTRSFASKHNTKSMKHQEAYSWKYPLARLCHPCSCSLI